MKAAAATVDTLIRRALIRGGIGKSRNSSPGSWQYPCEVEDEGLLRLAWQGDEQAFAELFTRHQGPIYRYAVHMCGREAGDDIVQDTFLALLRRNGQYDRTRGPLVGYLFGIARHIVLKQLASLYQSALTGELDGLLNGEVALDQPSVLDELTRAEAIAAVRAAVQSLPPPYREVIVLCELQDIDYAVAADIVQCPIGTIRSRLHRARALLTTKLAAMQPLVCGRQE